MKISDNMNIFTVRKKILLASKLIGVMLIVSYMFSAKLPIDTDISFAVWMFFVVVLIFVIDLLMARFISKPVSELNAAARRMAELDFSDPCTVTGLDEFGELSRSLNRMGENLQQAFAALEDANVKLEQDIEQKKRLLNERKELVDKEDDFDVESELKRPAFSKKGDLWHLGKHTVICGDSTLPETYTRLMGEVKANLVCTDPPYMVALQSTSGTITNDDLNDHDAVEFLMKAFSCFHEAMANDALWRSTADAGHPGTVGTEHDGGGAGKKRVGRSTREMTTPLFLLRCVELGIAISDLDLLTIGLVIDMWTEKGNDDVKYKKVAREATQEDFDAF